MIPSLHLENEDDIIDVLWNVKENGLYMMELIVDYPKDI